MNFKDMNELFFISGTSADVGTSDTNHRFLQRYSTGTIAAGDWLKTTDTITLDLKVNACYRVQPIPMMTIINETVSNHFVSRNV